ncbi:MAG: hypothetical protein DMF71_16630 [Acidobacteria bacterium]|nr:MAG: hypothetical protein DMF71_16630 [Acidobacteriota bacterium]
MDNQLQKEKNMKEKNKLFALVALMGVAALIIANWQTTGVRAFNPQPDPPALGAFGITHEQTARLSARVFVADRDSTKPIQPVEVEFIWSDSMGNLVGDSTQTIQPGHVAFLDLNGATLPIGGDGMRGQIEPGLKILNNPNGGKVEVIPSFETFDNSGPDAGKSRMGITYNHNETLLGDTARRR